VNLHVARLDDQPDELLIVAERQSGDAGSVLYSFAVSAGGRPLLDGRATAVLDVATLGLPAPAAAPNGAA
jgi:predicted hotdog family 3-hydroxylacyl-ACP dehydratase